MILLVCGLWYCRDKGHFCLRKITASLPYQAAWEVAPPALPEDVLSQTYSYIKGGTQSFAFQSEDQKYVLKFFKMKHLLPQTWLNYLPIPRLLDHYRYRKVDKHLACLHLAFGGYKLAYDHLKEETALIAVHLNETKNLYPEITVIDHKGKKHKIPLDKVPFVIQKKVEPISIRMLDKTKQAQTCEAVLKLVTTRCEKGFGDIDGEIRRNYGFIGDTAVQFDVGRLFYDDSLKKPERMADELEHVSIKLAELKDMVSAIDS